MTTTRKLTAADLYLHCAERDTQMVTSEGLHVIDTCRSYPRTLRQAWPQEYDPSAIGIDGPVVIPTAPPLWVRAIRRLAEIIGGKT